VSALVVTQGGRSSGDRDRKLHVLGVTRADVARVEWFVPSGTLDIETFERPELPQLRFFFIEDPARTVPGFPGSESEIRAYEPPHVIAYGADGAVLADSKEIEAYDSAHTDEIEARVAEVDRRRGVESKDAGIANVRVEDGMLWVEMYKCEGDPLVAWTEDAAAIKVSATVKRPVAEGPCLSGETGEVGTDFDKQPIGDRPIIDALTGEVLVEAGSGL
jgi:hypothetical protein